MNQAFSGGQGGMTGHYSGKDSQPKLTAYERRQLEEQQKNAGATMTLEDRLAKLKQKHQKPKRPGSGNAKKLQRLPTGMSMMGPAQPLDPLQF